MQDELKLRRVEEIDWAKNVRMMKRGQGVVWGRARTSKQREGMVTDTGQYLLAIRR